MQLQIDAVLQPQHLELVLGQFTGQAPLHLIAKLGDAFVDQRAVDFVISVHDKMPYTWTGRPMVTPERRICSRRLPGSTLPPSPISTGAI